MLRLVQKWLKAGVSEDCKFIGDEGGYTFLSCIVRRTLLNGTPTAWVAFEDVA